MAGERSERRARDCSGSGTRSGAYWRRADLYDRGTKSGFQRTLSAEREGFEPPGLIGRLLSRQLQSTGLCHRSEKVLGSERPSVAYREDLLHQVLASIRVKDVEPIVRIGRCVFTTYP